MSNALLLAATNSNNLNTGYIWVAAICGAIAIVLVGFLRFLAVRYKRCPSNRVLVIYGKVSKGEAARCLHGGGAFVDGDRQSGFRLRRVLLGHHLVELGLRRIRRAGAGAHDGQRVGLGVAAADPELFRHSMQNPPEWSVRGFEIEMEKVKAFLTAALCSGLSSGPSASSRPSTLSEARSSNRCTPPCFRHTATGPMRCNKTCSASETSPTPFLATATGRPHRSSEPSRALKACPQRALRTGAGLRW